MLTLSKIEEALLTYVKPQTYPLAIKMLRAEDEVSGQAKNPLRDFGVSFTLCQALALARREALPIVLDADSQSCPIALVGLGFVRPEAYLSGKYALAPINQSTEARVKAASTIPRFSYGKFRQILISPIAAADFDPDVILFYGSGVQVMRLIQASSFASGESLTSRSTGSGGCLLPVVASIVEDACKYAIPGNGERRAALTGDDEIAFAMPRSRYGEVIQGLKSSHEGKQRYPISPSYLKLEYKLPPSYVELRKALFESSK